MSRKKYKNCWKRKSDSPARISPSHQIAQNESAPNRPISGSEAPDPPTASDLLLPRCPDPTQGFETLASFQVERLTGLVMENLAGLCRERGVALNTKYWRRITQEILASDSRESLIIPARAGSGKSTWLLAFLRAFAHLCREDPRLDRALVGITVVVQKVETLNQLVEQINNEDSTTMVALQGWNPSGSQRGFCANPEVIHYDQCRRYACPYSEHCRLLSFQQQAPCAPVVGLTQERFVLLREAGALDKILRRTFLSDQVTLPRRFLIFDEKITMAQTSTLNKPVIDQASTEIERLIRQGDLSDSQARSLQMQLSICIDMPFQRLRKEAEQSQTQDHPVPSMGWCTLEDDSQRREQYNTFRRWVCSRRGIPRIAALNQVFSVMDLLYAGVSCPFCRSDGFTILRAIPPQLGWDGCQTILFDATAPVDEDYAGLTNCRFLDDVPREEGGSVTLTVYRSPSMGVSKSALQGSSWKLTAFTRLAEQLVREAKGPVFLCSYQVHAEFLAEQLSQLLSPEDFRRLYLMPDRDVPTLPYFNGTNGANDFHLATTVILLGYPRLDPVSYVTSACAAYGEEAVRRQWEEAEASSGRPVQPTSLPLVQQYIAHHLAARLEQEIYRCAIRNPGNQKPVTIHLFCPPEEVLAILESRLPSPLCKVEITQAPPVFASVRDARRQYKGAPTSRARFLAFLEDWGGSFISTTELRKTLEISYAVWKDLLKDPHILDMLRQQGIDVRGRGSSAGLCRDDNLQEDTLCA